MNYKDLPPTSRIWIYQASRNLSPIEVNQIETAGQEFIAKWATHGKSLRAALKVLHNRFIVLFADEEQVKASGCSIDASVHFMKEIEKALGIDLFDRMQIAYKAEGEIKNMHLNHFREALDSGEIHEDTIIFNNLLTHKKELESSWEIPVKDSWIADSLKV